MKKKIMIPIVVVLLVAALTCFMLKNGKESIYAGNIEATKVDISTRVSSVIEKIMVDESDDVKEKDVLFTLTCEDIKLKMNTLKDDYNRAKKLLSSGTIPRENYDHAKLAYDDASLRWDWCKVMSPLDGTVLDKYREEGELVAPGTKILTIADLSDVWAYVYVDEPLMSRVSLNTKVKGLLPDLNGKIIEGTVTRINEEAEFTPKNVQTRKERTRLVYGIKISFDNKERVLKPGMPIEVEFPLNEKN